MLRVIVDYLLLPHGSTKPAVDCLGRERDRLNARRARFNDKWVESRCQGLQAFNHRKQKLKYWISCYSDASEKSQRCFSPLSEK